MKRPLTVCPGSRGVGAETCLTCDCGNIERWSCGYDQETGSTLIRCKCCGKFSGTAATWINWKVGMRFVFEDESRVLGSQFTCDMKRQLFTVGSGLTGG